VQILWTDFQEWRVFIEGQNPTNRTYVSFISTVGIAYTV
jgi:hypothetical protein